MSQEITTPALTILSAKYNLITFTYMTKELAEEALKVSTRTKDYNPETERPTINVVFVLNEQNKLYFWWKEMQILVSPSEMIADAVRADHRVVFNGNNTTLSFPTDSGIMDFGDKFWMVGFSFNRDGFVDGNTGFTTLLQSGQCRFVLEHTNMGLYITGKASGYHAGRNTYYQFPTGSPMLHLVYWNPNTSQLTIKFQKPDGSIEDSIINIGATQLPSENNGFLNIGKMDNDPMNAWSSTTSKYSFPKGKFNNLIVKVGAQEFDTVDSEGTIVKGGHLQSADIADYFSLSQEVDQNGQPLEANFIKGKGFYSQLDDFVSFDNFTVVSEVLTTVHTEKTFLGDGSLKFGTIEPTPVIPS